MHDGPVIAAALVGGVPYTSGIDGRVIRWTTDLHVDAVLREDEANPIHSLAAYEGALVGLDAHGVVDWTTGQPVTTELPSLEYLVVRGTRAYAVAEKHVVVLEKKKTWRVAKKVAREPGPVGDFDVDESGTFAVVVRSPNLVEVLDLSKGTPVGAWTRKDKSQAFHVRFAPKNDALLVTDGHGMCISHMKAKSGRASPAPPCAYAHVGAIATDARNAAVCTDGEDVMVLTKDGSELLHIVLDARPSEEKQLAARGRIMRFRERFPGFFQKVGSTQAREPDLRQTALAIDGAVIAGYVDGDVLRIEPDTGRVDSAQHGLIAPSRSVQVIDVPSESVFVTVDGDLWILTADGVRIVDLDRRTIRRGPQLDGWAGIRDRNVWDVAFTDDSIVCINGGEARMYRRSDGAVLARQAIPSDRGAIFFEGAIAFLPRDRVSFEGFTVERLDLSTGARTEYASYRCDPPRTGGGNPTDSARLSRVGKQITATAPDRGIGLFDPRTATFGPPLPRAIGDAKFRYQLKTGARTTAIAEGGRLVAYDLDRPDFPVLADFALDGDLDRAKPAIYSRESGRSAAATPRSRIVVWERDGKRVTEILGHRNPTEMWLSPNGRTLAVHFHTKRSILRLWALD